MSNIPKNSFTEFERASQEKGKEQYVLRLFISGMTPRSVRAIENLKKICDKELKGCYRLEITDISQQPEAVKKEDLIATPTLIKELPKPIRKIIGDLSDTERILIALNLTPKNKQG
ncbi:MAG: circadian clock KaiB family protein [Candidatus Bathyarchaeia archaeon]|jgi:circadian clock protein KaiB